MKIGLSRTITFLFALTFTLNGWSWGWRGHHTVCEASVFLVKNKELKDFLQHKANMMGHLCNIPDIHWKSLGSEVGKQGNPTHYLDPEILGLKINEIPLDYQKIISSYTGKKNSFKEGIIFSIPTEFGSNWWRADQFYRRAIAAEKSWKTAVAPSNSKEEQDDNLPYNKLVYDFFVNLGLMGHFVGDNGQPFHSTADHDGWFAGHGGIHGYYEEAVVAAFPYNLTAQVVEDGMKLQKIKDSKDKKDHKLVSFLAEKTVLEKMRGLSQSAFAEIQTIYSLDPIKKPSIQKDEKGMLLRTRAEREPAKTVAAKYQTMIVRDMARSAVLLAQLWDMAYEKIGSPKLAAYKSYQFPFMPEFIPPDYFDQKDLEKNK